VESYSRVRQPDSSPGLNQVIDECVWSMSGLGDLDSGDAAQYSGGQ
jgi:hypothetical protein